MKFIHLSDLHIGKKVNEFSMIEDQKFILMKIQQIIDDEKPDGILIAGDIYDKSIPPAEAVTVFDDFLVTMVKKKQQVFIISGNHDSAERLAFGNRIMDASGIHISSVYNGKSAKYTLSDEAGNVNIYMLPFIKPAMVRSLFPDEEIKTYTDAVAAAVGEMAVNTDERNIIVTHQFITSATRSESEELSVGGTDNVDASVFDDFDYVALGHIHGPQNIGEKRIRYCGTPLKYSFSEAKHQKSVTVVELNNKGDLQVRTIPLQPRHDMVEIKSEYNELMKPSYYENTTLQEDYVHITLTDETDIPDVINKLRCVYHNVMKVDYDNTRTRTQSNITGAQNVDEKTPFELFNDFYKEQNGRDLNKDESEYIKDLIEHIWGE